MSSNGQESALSKGTLIGHAVVPVQFGEQVIVSLLYNHDANPVHHRPDHAIQWMLGLLSAQGVGGNEGGLERAGSEERTYSLGAKLLARQDVVVMPGIVLAAICYERFIPPTELTAALTTTFTYPLLVPTKGAVDVEIEAHESPASGSAAKIPGGRNVVIEAFGPGISGQRVRLLKMEGVVFKAGTSPQRIFEEYAKPQFDELATLKGKLPELPALTHPSSISLEDRRRYSRIVDPDGALTGGSSQKLVPITESAWQCKIPRVLTEVIDYLRCHEAYQKEVRAYYADRPEEKERREAITRYVAKEIKYRRLKDEQGPARVEELMQMRQHLYARQHSVYDPRQFSEGGPATHPGIRIILDLQLSEIRLRRSIHRLYTCGRMDESVVFMGEAMVTAQPLVTKELANFLCEINYSFTSLKLQEYSPR